MRTKFVTLTAALSLAFISMSAVSCSTDRRVKSAPLVIQEQGSFSAGGTVIREDGVFDPIKQGAYTTTFKVRRTGV